MMKKFLSEYLGYIALFLFGAAVMGIFVVGLSSQRLIFALSDVDRARGMITFLVAVLAVSIMLAHAIAALFLDMSELKERMEYSRGLLTVIVGILGTIIGFYYGAGDKGADAANQAHIIEEYLLPGGAIAWAVPDAPENARLVLLVSEKNELSLIPTPGETPLHLLARREDLCPSGLTLQMVMPDKSRKNIGVVTAGKDTLFNAGWKACSLQAQMTSVLRR